MRARVLITNGVRTIDLFWLSHDGSDVYCGQPKFDGKRSYHASGKIHSTVEGKKLHEAWHTPLRDLKGQFHLTTIGLSNSAQWFDAVAPRYEYTKKKSDALLLIDSRSIPEGITFNVSVGLLEPGNTNVLNLMLIPLNAEEFSLSAQQVLLSTSVEPWVYVILYWLQNQNGHTGGYTDPAA
jgi:hypothetical protein